uniref:Uncharacterized protein n=1 Tax=Zea mays TaxID=4577 RepID=C4J822_MAIZE|nr:unknown [Zea mays]
MDPLRQLDRPVEGIGDDVANVTEGSACPGGGGGGILFPGDPRGTSVRRLRSGSGAVVPRRHCLVANPRTPTPRNAAAAPGLSLKRHGTRRSS